MFIIIVILEDCYYSVYNKSSLFHVENGFRRVIKGNAEIALRKIPAPLSPKKDSKISVLF